MGVWVYLIFFSVLHQLFHPPEMFVFITRALVEDVYVKSLSKLHKTVTTVPETQFG